MVSSYVASSSGACSTAEVGVAGGGGEYQVLAGFGWTNGVALSFLERYGWQPSAIAE